MGGGEARERSSTLGMFLFMHNMNKPYSFEGAVRMESPREQKEELIDMSEWFWEIIERASRDRDKLRSILSVMPKEDINRFQREFLGAATQLRYGPFSDLVYASGDSEDGLDDISNWVVSQGRPYYESVYANPDTIPLGINPGNPQILYGVAGEVYEERFGELLGIY